MKTCSRCGVQKDREAFSKNSRAKDGLKAACKVCLNAEHRAYSLAHPEAAKARQTRWLQENPEKARAKDARYRAAHPELVKQRVANWEKNNPEARRILQHKRRARQMAAGVYKVSKAEIMAIRSQPCLYCGSKDRITVDHIIPLVRGGRHSLGNLAPACLPCNSQKRHRTITEWRKSRKTA